MKKVMSFGLTMMALSSTGCAGAATRGPATGGRMIEFKSGPEGFDTKTFFYEGAHEVVAFDAQFTPALAQKAIARLREVTQKPITWVVVTHPNPDKFNGASVFQAQGAKVIASQATADAIPGVHAYKKFFFVESAKMFKADEYPAQAKIDQTFQGQTDLVLRGGERIQLRELSRPGVSRTQTVAFVPGAQSLVVGDLVHHRTHAWLEGGIVGGAARPTIAGWIADLRELATLFPAETTVLGGRGEAGPLSEVVPAQIAYLERADQLVGQYVRELGPRATELTGAQAQTHFQTLQKRFEAAFPGFDLGYMIGYGVYGLALQKMSVK